MRAHRIAPLAAVLIALSACGDGGGIILTPPDDDDDPPTANCTDATPCGEVRIALTDGDGDFLSYTVDVVSIRLERSNGDTVQALPNRQRVDFAELLDVSELVTVTDIPTGTYERAIIRLDYSDAEVSVEVDGLPTAAAVVDVNGDALGQVDVDLRLDAANPLVVASNAAALLQLDFDLEGSHEVNLATTPATVTAAPFLAASLEPVDTREFRVRGPLVSVNEGDGRYRVDLRPFSQRTGRNGELRVETTTDTTCEVDGDALDIVDCLAAMADLPENTLTAAHGEYDVDARTFTAERVLAGSSVPGAEFDTVIGTVAARNLDELVVRGATVVRTDGSVAYARGDIEVALGGGTDVTRDGGSPAPLDIDDISVGQRIQAFGDASASDFNPTLDATGGRVRLHRTQLIGTVVNTTPGELRLDLFSINGRDPQFFDFDGTGTSLITEANPEDYQVGTGNLNLNDFEDGEGAAAFGFVTRLRRRAAGLHLAHAGRLRRAARRARRRLGIHGHGSAVPVPGPERPHHRRRELRPRRAAAPGDRPAGVRHRLGPAGADRGRAGRRRAAALRGRARAAGRALQRLRGFRGPRECAAGRRLEHAGADGARNVRPGHDDAHGGLRGGQLPGPLRNEGVRPRQVQKLQPNVTPKWKPSSCSELPVSPSSSRRSP